MSDCRMYGPTAPLDSSHEPAYYYVRIRPLKDGLKLESIKDRMLEICDIDPTLDKGHIYCESFEEAKEVMLMLPLYVGEGYKYSIEEVFTDVDGAIVDLVEIDSMLTRCWFNEAMATIFRKSPFDKGEK